MYNVAQFAWHFSKSLFLFINFYYTIIVIFKNDSVCQIITDL